MRTNLVFVSGAVTFKKAKNGRIYWFLIKQSEDGDWEIPKIVVRKGESSVRASIRMMGEQGGMSVKVLEEAGRSGGSTTVGGKVVPRRQIYYLACCRASGEILGFSEHMWQEYPNALKSIKSKIEKDMLKQAKKELTLWQKENEIPPPLEESELEG